MNNLKEIISNYSRWSELHIICTKIESFLDTDFSIAAESCKSLIETICKTILEEKGFEYSRNEKIQSLVGKTVACLELNSSSKQLKQLSRQLVTFVKNIAEIRNNITVLSHGRSLSQIKKDGLDAVTSSFLVQSTSSVCSFLIQYFENTLVRKPSDKPLIFSDYDEFHNFIDDQYDDVIIAEIAYPTSEALFHIDETAFKTRYQEYLESLDD